jgi:protein disulfide-isomerase
MAQNVGVQGVLSSSSTINMLFLELNTLKPLKTLEKVWEEGDFESKITVLNSANDDSCGIDGCN